MSESLGALLSRVRLEQGKSQLRVAELLCAASGLATITRHEISRWEREERIPGGTWLRWLAVVLDTPLDELERAAAVARERRETDVTGAVPAERLPRPPERLPRPAAGSGVGSGVGSGAGSGAGSGVGSDVGSAGSDGADGGTGAVASWPAERAARRARLRELRRMDDLVAGPELAAIVQRELRAWAADAQVPGAGGDGGQERPGSGHDGGRERPGAGLGGGPDRPWTGHVADPEHPHAGQPGGSEHPEAGHDAGRRLPGSESDAGQARPGSAGDAGQARPASADDAGQARPGAGHERSGPPVTAPLEAPSPIGEPGVDLAAETTSRSARERLTLVASLAQLAGWVAADAAAPEAALAAFRLGLRAAERGGDRPLAGHLLGCLAQLAAEDGDARAALRLARSAQRRAGATASAGVRGLLALRVAYAAAVAGLRRDCEEALAAAERAAAQRDARLDPDWLYWFDDAHAAALVGRSLAALGRPAAARPVLESAMRAKILRFRAAGITGAALATARLGTGDVDAACAAATDALVACVQSGSVRAASALRAFDRRLGTAAPAGRRPPAVRDYARLVEASQPYLPTLRSGPIPLRVDRASPGLLDRRASILQDAQPEPRRTGGIRPG